MSTARIKTLATEVGNIKTAIKTINDRAESEGRDLSESENADVQRLVDRARHIEPELQELRDRQDTLNSVSDLMDRLGVGTPSDAKDRATVKREPAPAPLSAAEYFAVYFETFGAGGTRDVERFLDRAAPDLDRALAEMTTADTAGILPEPIVGEVIKLADSARPVFNALTGRPMPSSGKKFQRPRITQRVNVGEQDPELEEVVSRKMTLTSDEVTKRTFAGGLRLSQQDIDWTDPAILSILLADFVDYYAEVTEDAACTHLTGLVTAAHAASAGSGHSAFDDTDVGTLVTSYVDGFVKVYGKAKRMPTHVFHDLASAAVLAGTTNAQGTRTALSLIREALGELGIAPTFVVGPRLAADTRIIAAGSLIETYEQRKGLLQAVVPSAIATDLAYHGYVAFWGRHESVVQLGTAPA